MTSIKDYKVILVSSTTHHYYNIASVRGRDPGNSVTIKAYHLSAIIPGQFADEMVRAIDPDLRFFLLNLLNHSQVFQEIAPGFKNYPEGLFELVHGTATSLEPSTKTVTVTTPSSTLKTIVYDILVLATGTRTIGEVPWKSAPEGYERTLAGLHKIQDQVKAAKSIVVGGGGPTGVETAAELGFEYGKTKEISLVTSGHELLVDSMPTNLAQSADAQIKSMDVNVIKGVKVLSSISSTDGQTELALSNGDKMVVDLYLPTIGMICNTEYVPKVYLNDKGQVNVDEFLRVKDAEDIWAAGDLTNVDFAQIVYCEKQATAVAKNLDALLKGTTLIPYKTGGARIMGLCLGRSKAIGRLGTWRIPSIVIWWFSKLIFFGCCVRGTDQITEGRTLGTENLPKVVTGSAL